MKISEVVNILDADVVCGAERLDQEVTSGFGADMMSDVLAYMDSETLLLTGLMNTHVIRTAEMLELCCIVFVRGKRVSEEIMQMAEEQNIVILATPKTLYESCGLLYANGLPGHERG